MVTKLQGTRGKGQRTCVYVQEEKGGYSLAQGIQGAPYNLPCPPHCSTPCDPHLRRQSMPQPMALRSRTASGGK